MKSLLQILAIVLLLTATINAQGNEAKKLCDAEIKKEVINQDIVKEQCIKTAKFYEDKKNYESASWYYLLGGNSNKIIDIFKNIIINNTNYIYGNIGHSYILKGDIATAKEFYIKLLNNASVNWVDRKTQYTYRLLFKLYPEKTKNLTKGLSIWNNIYKPLLDVNELYYRYKQSRKEKRYKEAINCLSKIIELQKKSNSQNKLLIIENQYSLGVMYSYNKEYSKSLKLLHSVEKIYENEKSKEKDLGNLYNSIAKNFIKKGNSVKALQYYKKSLLIIEKVFGKEDLKIIRVYDNFGLYYEHSEKYFKALQYYKKSLLIIEKLFGCKSIEIGRSYDNIARIYSKTGDYSNAFEYYKKSLVIKEKVLGKEHRNTAKSYNDLGSFYETMGDYSKALEYYNKALSIRERVLGIEHASTGISYNNLGLLYRKIGDYTKALEYLKKALIIEEGNNTLSEAVIYNNLGSIYKSMKNYRKALKYYKKSLKIKEKKLNNKHSSIAMSYNNLGSFYESRGDYTKALEYYKKAIPILEKNLNKNHVHASLVYNNIGSLYKAKGDYPKAYNYAKLSYDNFIINRDKNFAILSNKQKKLYLKSNTRQVPLLLETAYIYSNDKKQIMKLEAKKRLAQTVLNDWLHYKGSIYDSENRIITLYENTKDKNLKAKIDSLMQSKRKLAKLYQTLPKTKQERKTYQQRIKDTIKVITDIETFIASKASSFKEELGLRTISYKDISKNLKDNELYIDYAKAGRNYYIFTLDSKDNITFNQIDKKDTKSIDKNIRKFRKDIDTILNVTKLSDKELTKLKASSKKKLSKLYTLALKKPLKDKLSKYSNLIISSDGALRLMPFGTMYNQTTNKYLLEEKNIRYIPSAKELVRLYRQKNSKSTNKVVLFDNPDFNAKGITVAKADTLDTPSTNQSRAGIIKSLFKMRFPPLLGTKEEAEDIKQTLNAKNIQEYAQDNAKEENLLKVNKPKILHIATHGFFINDDNIPNPMLKSGIALSGANVSAIKGKSDGIVTSLKLSGLNLKGTNLVVLSACQTGVVDINSTENVSGLNKAFIQAGAKNIVMSLWSVNDQATKDLMSDFYKEMQTTPDYAQALRDSKLKMIKKDMHPFYWAAFVVSGVDE